MVSPIRLPNNSNYSLQLWPTVIEIAHCLLGQISMSMTQGKVNFSPQEVIFCKTRKFFIFNQANNNIVHIKICSNVHIIGWYPFSFSKKWHSFWDTLCNSIHELRVCQISRRQGENWLDWSKTAPMDHFHHFRIFFRHNLILQELLDKTRHRKMVFVIYDRDS